MAIPTEIDRGHLSGLVRDTLLEPPDRPVKDVGRAAFALDADTPVYEALTRFREASEQLAAVIDDGRFVGVITLADVVRRVLPYDIGTAGRVNP